jgi:hypothetical protein
MLPKILLRFSCYPLSVVSRTLRLAVSVCDKEDIFFASCFGAVAYIGHKYLTRKYLIEDSDKFNDYDETALRAYLAICGENTDKIGLEDSEHYATEFSLAKDVNGDYIIPRWMSFAMHLANNTNFSRATGSASVTAINQMINNWFNTHDKWEEQEDALGNVIMVCVTPIAEMLFVGGNTRRVDQPIVREKIWRFITLYQGDNRFTIRARAGDWQSLGIDVRRFARLHKTAKLLKENPGKQLGNLWGLLSPKKTHYQLEVERRLSRADGSIPVIDSEEFTRLVPQSSD